MGTSGQSVVDEEGYFLMAMRWIGLYLLKYMVAIETCSGMIIANGGMLYKGYMTHPNPFAYYLFISLILGRAAIVAACVLGSIGSAFVSAYTLVGLVLEYLVVEVQLKAPLKNKVKRFGKIAVASSIPYLLAIIYFKANQALGNFYQQAYKFNREIYPIYTGGFRNNIWQY